MKEWKEVKLKDICEFKYGGSLPAHSRVDGTYPVYGSSNIVSFHNEFLVKGPGIIVGRKGTVGKVQYSKDNFYPIDTTFYIEHNVNEVDQKFLFYRLPLMGLEEMNSDAAVPGLNRTTAINQKLQIPPLQTQKKIAKILSKYDDLIENNNKRIKLFEEFARLTYNQWFLDYRVDGVKLEINSETGLPIGWEVKKIKDFGKVVTGKTPSTANIAYYNGDIPFVKTPNMHQFPYVIETNEYLSREGANTQKNQFIEKNSLMVSCIGSAGVYALATESCQTNQQINSIKFFKEEYSFYVYCFAQFFKTILELLGSNGATMTNVNKTKFENIKVVMPDSLILEKFHLKVKNDFENILNLMNQNQLLKEARDILLPRLMTGVINIEEMDIAV